MRKTAAALALAAAACAHAGTWNFSGSAPPEPTKDLPLQVLGTFTAEDLDRDGFITVGEVARFFISFNGDGWELVPRRDDGCGLIRVCVIELQTFDFDPAGLAVQHMAGRGAQGLSDRMSFNDAAVLVAGGPTTLQWNWSPGWLTVAAVPEPASAGLLLLGLLGVLATGCSRPAGRIQDGNVRDAGAAGAA